MCLKINAINLQSYNSKQKDRSRLVEMNRVTQNNYVYLSLNISKNTFSKNFMQNMVVIVF